MGEGRACEGRPSVEELVALLGLERMEHEHVLYAQTYRAPRCGGDGKPLGTAIVAVLEGRPGSFSDLHRLPTDELWHFYLGDPIELLLLHPDGRDELLVLGDDVRAGERFQVLVPRGTWMGARVAPGGELGVFGCTMAPGFVDADFERADGPALAARYPARAELIHALT